MSNLALIGPNTAVRAVVLLILSTCFSIAWAQKVYHVRSPDGNYDFGCYQQRSAEWLRRQDYKGVRIINASRLDLSLNNHYLNR